ncbi:hypothetical protein RHMOL_Rhmol08G0174100 [Rhododendron molle]|uniref:Uncharacterized protein n=1 Tax=Rhododendron molle TaxID=49168 RepID=A0ACC0MPL5_RHOML|nr:hypothetical protein RHMOL_Rhmol08G0174100 [Rhododendron molle]
MSSLPSTTTLARNRPVDPMSVSMTLMTWIKWTTSSRNGPSDVSVGEKVESRVREYTELELFVIVRWSERMMIEAVIPPEKKGTIADLTGGCGRRSYRFL